MKKIKKLLLLVVSIVCLSLPQTQANIDKILVESKELFELFDEMAKGLFGKLDAMNKRKYAPLRKLFLEYHYGEPLDAKKSIYFRINAYH